MASKIYVSRSLIARYENGSAIPSKENLEKLSLFFDVKLTYLIDDEEIVGITLNQNKIAQIIDDVFSFLIIIIESTFCLISLLPIFKIKKYCYNGNLIPNIEKEIVSLAQVTLLHNNIIVLITILFCIVNICLSLMILINKNNKYRIYAKLINYIMFVLILFLIFFSIVFSIIYLNNNIYDFK